MDYKKMKFNDIVEWCKANNQVEWLKKEVEIIVVDEDKDGNEFERDISFIEIKRDFAEKFMPEIAPQRKPKKPTMKDIVAAL